jgi:hypothetical protein
MVWEGKSKYKTVDAALDDLEAALKKSLRRLGKQPAPTHPPPNATWKLIMSTRYKLVAFGGGAR